MNEFKKATARSRVLSSEKLNPREKENDPYVDNVFLSSNTSQTTPGQTSITPRIKIIIQDADEEAAAVAASRVQSPQFPTGPVNGRRLQRGRFSNLKLVEEEDEEDEEAGTNAGSRRASSIALRPKYTMFTSKFNRNSLRRYSLNSPHQLPELNFNRRRMSQSEQTKGKKFPLEKSRKLTESNVNLNVDLNFSTTSTGSNYTANKFISSLSKPGQCAMIKTYEDELYNRIKYYLPKQCIPRVSTARFQANHHSKIKQDHHAISKNSLFFLKQHQHHHSEFSKLDNKPLNQPMGTKCHLTSDDSSIFSTAPKARTQRSTSIDVGKYCQMLSDTSLNSHIGASHGLDNSQMIINEQIDAAMKILDILNECKQEEENLKLANINNYLNVDNSAYYSKLKMALRKYEIWHLRWSKILDEYF